MFPFGKRKFAWPRELRSKGILGINARNSDYVLPCNLRERYPRVDDKVLTKKICQAHGITVPKTYAVIQRSGDIRRLPELVARHPDFVVKPANGSEGRGIVVVVEHDEQVFVTAGGNRLDMAELRYHLSTILAGLYSLGGQVDRVILEQRIVRHEAFQHVAVGGTPDIRIILYRCVPVMAMVRLPTKESRGRANLHQGAIAAGIHLRTGCTFGGVCKDRTIDRHPDTGAPIVGLQIPMWDRLLAGAMQLAEGLELGYVGVDFVLDTSLGPVVLEANARPGLAIQVANRRGLRPRLQYIDNATPDCREGPRRLELVAHLAEMA
jgi:alpha-L-glutamate ligase-like protein